MPASIGLLLPLLALLTIAQEASAFVPPAVATAAAQRPHRFAASAASASASAGTPPPPHNHTLTLILPPAVRLRSFADPYAEEDDFYRQFFMVEKAFDGSGKKHTLVLDLNGRLHALLHEATAAATAPLKLRMDVGSLAVPKSLLRRVYVPRVKAEGDGPALERLTGGAVDHGGETTTDEDGPVPLRDLLEAGLIERVCRIEGNDCLFGSPAVATITSTTTTGHGNGHHHQIGVAGTHELRSLVPTRAEPAALYVRIDSGERVAERDWRECLLRN